MDRLSPPVGAEALIIGAGPTGKFNLAFFYGI
jgi:hypothetical protein